MRPVSAAFLRAVTGSHTMTARARVVTTYTEGTDPDGVQIPLFGGDVQLDGTAAVRSTLELSTDPALWPATASDLLTPYGNEVFVERAVTFGAGVTEWVSLGYFRIQSTGQDGAPTGAIRVAGQDRMAAIVDARLTAPRQYPAATTYGAVLAELIGDIYPEAAIEWDDDTDTATLDRSVIAEEDRHAFLTDLITAVGKIWYFDHRGVLVIRTPPDPTTPVFDVMYGAGGVLINLSQDLARDGVYNAVVATGEAGDTQPPARALVVDTNPMSPTVWGGRFGKVPKFYSSPLLTSDAQAESAARTLLQQSIGLPYSVDLSMVPNPALEPYDPVRVRYTGRHAPRVHVLDKLTVPLTADAAMSAATREQTFVIIGEPP